MTEGRQRPRLLVSTSTFPRWRGDSEPPFVYELSRRLTGRFEVTVLAPRAPGSLEQEILDGIEVIRFPYFIRRWENLATHGGGILNRLRSNRLFYLLVPLFLLGQCLTLARLLRTHHFDVIHAHWLIPQGLVAVLARWLARRPVPMLCTSHGGDLFALRSPAMRLVKRIVMRASSRITVVSSAMRTEVLDLGIPAEQVTIIPMGVDMQGRFTSDATPSDTVQRSDAPEILFVGRLVEKKGVEWLLRAMPMVASRFPGVRLTVAGDGPLEPSLKRLARELGIDRQVDFLGMVTQTTLPDLYRRATLFVAPFLVADSGDQEGFPLAPLEAIGCGCPIICGRVAAFGDVIRHEEEALLVPPRDEAALADAISTLLADPAYRARLAANARERCHRAFDWQTVATRYADLIASIIEASRADQRPG